MTPKQLRKVRRDLGLSTAQFAAFVGVAKGRTVRRWEAGDNDIPGAVVKLLEAVDLLRAVESDVQARGNLTTQTHLAAQAFLAPLKKQE